MNPDAPHRRLLALLPPVLLGALWLRLALAVPTLPERVPSHFGAGGRADGWMSPAGFGWFMALLPLFLYLVVAGSGWLIGRVPARWMNLPNREIWLAPERLEETRSLVTMHLNAIAALAIALCHGIAGISIDLARSGGAHLPPRFFWLVGAFVAGTLLSTVSLLVRFGRKPA